MSKKFTQKDLDKALDKIKQGPIGTKPQWYWENINNLAVTQTQEIKDIVKKNYSGEKRKKAIELGQITMNNDPSIRIKQQKGNTLKKKPVKAYKVYTTGSKRYLKVIKKEYIDTFPSQNECAIALNIPPGYVSGVLLKKYKTIKGYTFKYA